MIAFHSQGPSFIVNARLIRLSVPLLFGAALSACGGDSGSSSANSDAATEAASSTGADAATASFITLNVNAASYEDWQYVNLTDASVVTLDATAAAASTDWHIALRRNAVKLNGGASGPGAVRAALVDAQKEYYDAAGSALVSVFTNAVADIESDALSVVYATETLTWQSDADQAALTDWYRYDVTTHTIAAAPEMGFLVRHADGATYSRVQLTEASYTALALSYDTQAAETTVLDGIARTLRAEFGNAATRLCIDLDSTMTVACDTAAANWDLMYEVDTTARAINLWTNGGVYGSGAGGAWGMLAAAELAAYSSATLQAGYDVSQHYVADSSSGLFSDQPWYAYNLLGEHKLWPNFRTYLIDIDGAEGDATPYTLQIADYYSLGAAGSPQLRFQPMLSE